MFYPRVVGTWLTQPKVAAGQHDSGLCGITGSGARPPGAVASGGLEPANQVPRGTANGSGAGHRVERRQMQPCDGPCRRIGLSSNLDQLILAGEIARRDGQRVLCGGGNARFALFRCGRRRGARVTGGNQRSADRAR